MPKKGFKVITVDEETYNALEKIKRENNLTSVGDVVKELIRRASGTVPECDPKTGDSILDEEIKLLRELKICVARRYGDVYILDCGGRKAFAGKDALKTMAEKLGLNIFISE
jgi:predicted CopG family antitoxin